MNVFGKMKHYLMTLILIVVIGAFVDGANILLGWPLWDLTPSEMALGHLSVLLIYTAAYFSARWLLASSMLRRLRDLFDTYGKYLQNYGEYIHDDFNQHLIQNIRDSRTSPYTTNVDDTDI